MQYRLSTLFLIFFVVAASLALFGLGGIWVAFVYLMAALAVNRAHIIASGIFAAFVASFFAVPGFLWPVIQYARVEAKEGCSGCAVLQIGMALRDYLNVHKKFPPLYVANKDGKPLRSWRAEILPYMEYDALYKQLDLNEPWDSSINKNVLDQFPNETQFTRRTCALEIAKTPETCYMAVVGPGTAWRSDRPVSFSELPDGGSHTVMFVEVANSGVHWAAPRDLTVEEALEGLKTGKGLRISTDLTTRTSISLADGSARSLPTKMPLSLWKKLLAGELSREEIDNIKTLIDPNAPDMVEVSINPKGFEPGTWGIVFGILVWLFSLVLLFRRAIKSRIKPAIEQPSASPIAPIV
jgi:hypothetical protein